MMRFLLDLPGRFFELVGKLAVATLPILLGWALFGIVTTQCVQFRHSQSCMDDDPIFFWLFTGVISVAAMIYGVIAIFLLLNLWKKLRQRRNLQAQRRASR